MKKIYIINCNNYLNFTAISKIILSFVLTVLPFNKIYAEDSIHLIKVNSFHEKTLIADMATLKLQIWGKGSTSSVAKDNMNKKQN